MTHGRFPRPPLETPMRTTLLLPMFAILAATGCVVYESDHGHHAPPPPPPPPPPVVNYAPWVDSAEAGVYWDDYQWDDVWYFDAVVDDPEGPYDVVEVWG